MLPIIDNVLVSKSSSLETDFLSFTKKLYTGTWSSHQNEISRFHPVVPITNYSAFPVTSGTITLPHYSFALFIFTPSATAPQDLTIPISKASGITTVAFRKSSGGIITEFKPDPATGTITVTSFNAGTTEVALLICNNSTSDGQTANFSAGNSTVPTPPAVGGGSSGGGGGCFIATAAYGSYLHPKVRVLREFRDHYLLTNAPGRQLVALYYRLSPPLADIIARHEGLRTATRVLLTPMIFVVEHGKGTIAALGVVLMGGMLTRRRRQAITTH